MNVVVGIPDRPTWAHYWLPDSDETALFLETFVSGG